MDGAGTRGFDSAFDSAAQRAAERLATLREQRMRLAAVRDEVDASLVRHRASEIDPAWRSDAQRAYASRRDDLTRLLARALRLLNDALDSVHREITGLAAGQ